MREIVGIIAPEYTREREEEEEKPAPKVQLYKRKCCMRGKYRTKSWPFFGTKKTYECEETYFTECSEDPVCTREVMVKTQIFWGPTITKRRTDSFYQNTEDYSSRRPEKDIKFQKYPC